MICSLHATEEGWKEAERFICQGHWQSLPRPDPEVDISAIKLIWYWTSHKEIRDLYHDVYLLGRLPGPPPCRPWWREEGNLGHPLLPEEPLAQVRPHCHARGGPMRGCCSYPLQSISGSPSLGPRGGKTCIMRPPERP